MLPLSKQHKLNRLVPAERFDDLNLSLNRLKSLLHFDSLDVSNIRQYSAAEAQLRAVLTVSIRKKYEEDVRRDHNMYLEAYKKYLWDRIMKSGVALETVIERYDRLPYDLKPFTRIPQLAFLNAKFLNGDTPTELFEILGLPAIHDELVKSFASSGFELERLGDRNQRLRISSIQDYTPNEFICPITLNRMRDPVVASDGHTYERNAISVVLSQDPKLSPLTREPLSSELYPNHALRGRMNEHGTKRKRET